MNSFIRILFLLCVFSTSVVAQTYTMATTTVSTCSGTFYDTGGNSANYGDNQNLTMTFTSATGDRLSFAFTAFAVETCCDRLYIYDGPTNAYPLIGIYTSNPGTILSTGTSLTFTFTSDNGVNALGWAATISCATPALTSYPMVTGNVTACSGAFYDNGGANVNYSDNQNVTKTFCSGTTDYLRFDFWTNATNISAGDTLFVYDGSSVASPLIAAFTNGSFLESFTSSGTCITFVFKSNATGNASGWAGWFQCTTTAAVPGVYNMTTGIRGTCGGGFYDSGGSGNNYGNNENRSQTIQSINGNRISMTFSAFAVETCCDRLYIYDGPTTAYPLIGIYTSNPGTILSTGTALTFTFTSDNGTTNIGWAATVSCTTPALTVYPMVAGNVTACSGVFCDNGGQNTNYSDNQNVTKTICSGTTDFLRFDFWTNATNLAAGDTLFVYDGSTVSAPLLAAYTNGSTLESFTSSGTCITFRFKSNASGNASGWSGWFQCTTTPASAGVFNMSTGIRGTCGGGFYDSGGSGNNYGNSENRSQTIQSINGNRISMTFTSFAVETCCDRLYIYDGPTTAYPLIGIYTSNPGTIVSTGTSLTFTFTSDVSNTNTGWAASITCTTPALPVYTMVNGDITACEGVFTDNGGGGANYSDNQNVTKTFCSGTTDHLQFSFWTNATNLVAGDSLFVYDGNSISSPLLAIYVAGSNLETFISTGTCITFRFKSNASGNASGWAGWFQCTTASPSPGTFNMSSGVRYVCDGGFYDQGGNANNYPNNENRNMTLTSYTGNRISVAFTAFGVETCCDRLYIYDGPSTAYPLLGIYTGNPGTITSSGTSLTFVFTSDAANTGLGWAGTISCAGPVLPNYTMSSGTVVTCSGVFYDNGGPAANYPNNENRVMTFTSATGQYLKFDFNPNHFNIPTGDSLFVYDGTSISSPLFAVLTGGTAPGSLTSNTSSFTFRFKSDAATNNVGWQAWISCVSVPDNNPVINMSGGVRYTCGGTFYDPGGSANNYGNNENRTMTFYSNSGCGIRFTFTGFATESCCDRLFVYDGPSTASPLLATLSGTALPAPVQSTGNVLTFRLSSDASTTASGWSAAITCPSQPLALITPSGSTSICSNDSVTLTATANTSYLWNTGATTQSIVVHNAGSYWCSVANASGCTATSAITVVTVNAVPTPTVTANGPLTFCSGGNVTLTASGGSTYLWNTNATSAAITVTNGGNYTVTATGANGCSASTSPVTVTVNPLPNPSISASGPLSFCSGGNVTLTATGGSTYLWTTGSTASSITVNATGSYGVTATNSFGCTASATPVNVTVNPTPVAVVTAGGPTTFCSGGSVTLTASGGSTYLWSNSSTSSSINVTTSGTYSVVASNGGCSNTSTPLVVTVNPTPTVSITASGPLSFCSGGSVTLAATGGGTYLWTNGATSNSITVTTSGTYGVTATNSFGCTASATPVNVTVNPTPVAVVTASGPTTFCSGGSVTLTASGGSTYLWSNSSTSSSINVTTSGTYSVVASNGGCSNTSTPVVVTVNPTPTVSITASGPLSFCSGGSVTLTATGGGTYLWTNGATSNSITVTTSGTYGVTATNSFGCTASATPVNVTVDPTPVAVVIANGPTTFCSGGSVTLNASGGTTYLWSNSSTTSSINVSAGGTYSVIVSNGSCADTSSNTVVTVNPVPTPTITASGPLSFCSGGSVTLYAGGVGPFVWSNTATTDSINVTASGTYSVTETNSFGCSGTSSSLNVVVNTTPVAVITPSGPTTFCQGGSVTLAASGGSSYLWNTSSTSSSLAVSAPGVFSVIVSNGTCSDTSASVSVAVLPLPVVTLSLPVDTVCLNMGTVTLTGGSPAGGVYTGPGVSSGVFDPIVAGIGVHTVVYSFTDTNGCAASATQNVVVDVCNGIVPVASGSIAIAPNPADQSFFISFHNSFVGDVEVQIYDTQGKLIRTEMRRDITAGTRLEMNVSDLASGMYMIRLTNADQSDCLRLNVQH